ncbi:MAG TPA: arylamine N-acetyltransferase [Usitatibacter sp.]|jgi:N-hydroxyarylamine O-acetyltransferase|nr:arylamine N-acetyltransferase [Usitatibacter sp.]
MRELHAYFARIGFGAPAAPTLQVLSDLHRLHADAIPFENLAAFLGEPIRLDPASIHEKLVDGRRGGWCFEQNLLFARVLEAIGFPVRRLSARVRWNVPPGVVTARSHMLMRVTAEGREWIADVGFGGQSLTAPLLLVPYVAQPTPHETYRLLPEGDGFVLEADVAGEWQALYAFDLHEQHLADYEVSNWYLANHPQSQFVTGIVAARAGADRRHALRNARYAIHHRDGRTERRLIASVEDFRSVLEEDLRIPLPDSPRLDEGLARLVRVEREASGGEPR